MPNLPILFIKFSYKKGKKNKRNFKLIPQKLYISWVFKMGNLRIKST